MINTFFHFCFPICYLLSDIHNIVVEYLYMMNDSCLQLFDVKFNLNYVFS